MRYNNENNKNKLLPFSNTNNSLRADCGKCFGLCCVALYFSAFEGFPVDKEAGQPCMNLEKDFRCSVHNKLRELGLKGCTAYDCFGAGQKVAQITYGGQDWSKVPESAEQMYKVFIVMRQIHEMLWYLTEALMLHKACDIRDEISSMINETEQLTLSSPAALIELDLSSHREKVNTILLKTSEHIRSKFNQGQKNTSRGKKIFGRGLDLIGKDLRKADLKGGNFRGALLIAANLKGVDLSGADFLGADLRDTDLRGADLTRSIFLTQGQINTAIGDSNTKLPKPISRPVYWSK